MKGRSFHKYGLWPAAKRLALAILTGLCLLGPGRAADDPFRLVTPEIGYPPYIITVPDGPAQTYGIFIDLMHRLLPQTGHRLEIVFAPEIRARRKVKLGDVDALPNALEWIENPGEFRWSPGLFNVADSLVLPTPPMQLDDDLENLRGHIIGTMRNYYYPSFEPSFEQGFFTRSESATLTGLMKMIAMRRVSAAVIDERTARWVIRREQMNLENYHFTGLQYDPVPYRLMLSPGRDWNRFNRELEQALDRLRESGELEKIFNRYR